MTLETDSGTAIDPITLAVLGNRFDAIVREMTHLVLRSARSAIINTSRDLSCTIVTAEHELLASAEGLPIHIMGGQFQARALFALQDDIREGDAFLHNDPYNQSSHAADHTVIVPVFHGGEHVFTVCVLAHQADCGNSVPTTYMDTARDVYEEGALIFPAVRVQRDHRLNDDVMRMCRARIRVPDQWQGDFLAQLGAARVGERRLKELIEKYSIETLRAFVTAWFDYSERLIADAIGGLPSGSRTIETRHSPIRDVPEGLAVRATVKIDAEREMVDVDLRDNPDCVAAGINLTEVTSYASGVIGVLNALPVSLRANAGTFRRIAVHVRENCVVGIPRHPASCSAATTLLVSRVVNCVQSAIAAVADGCGLAENGCGHPPSHAIISGIDPRHDQAFVNELGLSPSAGGPAGPDADGWITFGMLVAAGLQYLPGVEVSELKQPILVEQARIEPDSEGPGRTCGAPGVRVAWRPLHGDVRTVFLIEDPGTAPRGVRGGLGNRCAVAWLRANDGSLQELTLGAYDRVLRRDEAYVSVTAGGGGYGPPTERDPEVVLEQVREGWISRERAASIYGVAIVGDDAESLELDAQASLRLRGG
jgi:N-methylhydantoinase B